MDRCRPLCPYWSDSTLLTCLVNPSLRIEVLQPWTNCAPGMSFGGFGCPRQPARQLTLDARALHLRDQVGPFVGVGAVVIQFLRAVGVTDVAPSVGANAVVALVVRRNRRSGALRRRVFQLRQEAVTFESGPDRQVAEFDQGRVKIGRASCRERVSRWV